MTDEILTLKEVAKYLKLAEKTAYRLAAEGKLPGFKAGGSWRPDGCSFAFKTSLETVPHASPACDRHDRCYSKIGETKANCDNILIGEMNK